MQEEGKMKPPWRKRPCRRKVARGGERREEKAAKERTQEGARGGPPRAKSRKALRSRYVNSATADRQSTATVESQGESRKGEGEKRSGRENETGSACVFTLPQIRHSLAVAPSVAADGSCS